MASAKSQQFTLEDFLKFPEVRPCLEFFGGRILQKMSPRLIHSILQGELNYFLRTYVQPSRLGQVYLELRCNFGGSSHVFDLSYFRVDRQPNPGNPQDRDQILIPPDLAIEILSPGQSVGELVRKLRSAIRRGVRLGWLIDDRNRSIHVLHPTRPVQILRMGDTLTGDEVMPGFTLPVAEIFGWLDED